MDKNFITFAAGLGKDNHSLLELSPITHYLHG